MAAARPRGARRPVAADAEALFTRLMEGPLRLPDADGLDTPARVGPWTIEGRIGQGGLSTVYAAARATPAGPERAALKLAKRPGGETRALFAHEARLLRRLRVPAVVGVLDVRPGHRRWRSLTRRSLSAHQTVGFAVYYATRRTSWRIVKPPTRPAWCGWRLRLTRP